MSKPANFYWNPALNRWETRGKSGVTMGIGEAGVWIKGIGTIGGNLNVGSIFTTDGLVAKVTGSIANANITTGTITNLNVGTLATLRTVNVAGQGSIANLNTTAATMTNINVGTLATIRAVAVAGQASLGNLNTVTGTLQALNVGTLSMLRDVAIAQTGSLDALNIGAWAKLVNATIGGGGTISIIQKVTGTLTGIAAIGSGAVAVGTVAGIGSAGIAVGDLVLINPKAALGGHTAFGGVNVATTNVVNVFVANTKPDSAGSLVDVGVDLLVVRST